MNLPKVSIKQEWLIVIVALLVFSFGIGLHLIAKNKKNSVLPVLNTSMSGRAKDDLPMPVRLKIPSINVDSSLEYVGLTPEGNVDVPTLPSSAAWFYRGPRPGEVGSSIIDGHSGRKNDLPAVFDELYKLKKGDKLYVEDSKGATETFVVRESKSYGRNADATDVFYAPDNNAHMNLITCTGDWNEIARTHSDRLVVFTDKE